MKILKRIIIVLVVITSGMFLYVANDELTNVDYTLPVIEFDENLKLKADATEEEYLEGIFAWDDKDGDLTDKVMIKSISDINKKKEAVVTYIVFDSDNKVAEAERTVKYKNYRFPQYELEERLMYTTTETINIIDELKAVDMFGNDISHRIRYINSDIVDGKEGEFVINVKVTDDMGGISKLSLPIKVDDDIKGAKIPELKLSQHLVYTTKENPIDFKSFIESVSGVMETSEDTRLTIDDVVTESDINYDEAGIYTVRYFVTDKITEETAQEILLVVVQ